MFKQNQNSIENNKKQNKINFSIELENMARLIEVHNLIVSG